jgi:hypothetical protein
MSTITTKISGIKPMRPTQWPITSGLKILYGSIGDRPPSALDAAANSSEMGNPAKIATDTAFVCEFINPPDFLGVSFGVVTAT